MLYDLAIIGGGINGVGIARDAAGRGLKVLLCEQNDIASGTSSYSSKLIHGGLRYLEYFDFRLVREALQERETLFRIAPHLIQPLPFIMPEQQQMRPSWMIRLGLFIYDHLAKRTLLPASKIVSLQSLFPNKLLLDIYNKGYCYFDAFCDDSRLVIANAKSAQELGATILNYTSCRQIENINSKYWQLTLEHKLLNRVELANAKTVINATGPWVNQLTQIANLVATPATLIKGSHILVPKLYSEQYAFILQNIDTRVIFVIPYQEEFSLIGTTDIAFTGDPSAAIITDEEIIYLCEAVNRYFDKKISAADILYSYAGVRALNANHTNSPAAISRDYKLELLNTNHPPFLNIIGGKITTHRRLAEQALALLQPYLKFSRGSWTANTAISGGNLPNNSLTSYLTTLIQHYPNLPTSLLQRYCKQYGNRCEEILVNCNSIVDLGKDFGWGLCEKEINYLISSEWAMTVDDILWRRTKLGLKFSLEQVNKLHQFLLSNIKPKN